MTRLCRLFEPWPPALKDLADLMIKRLELFIHLPINPLIKFGIHLMAFRVRLKSLAKMGHLIHSSLEIREEFQAHSDIHCSAQPGGLVDMGTGDGQPKDIGRDLHGTGALTAAAGHRREVMGMCERFSVRSAPSRRA